MTTIKVKFENIVRMHVRDLEISRARKAT